MRYILAIVLLGFAVTNFSCSYTAVGHKKEMYANSNGWFPEDFDPASVTLLIETPPKEYKKRIDTLLKNYPCKYQFIKDNKLGTVYNENIYRYIFKRKTWDIRDRTTTVTGTSYSTTFYADYYITDQVKKIDYPPTGYYTYLSNSYWIIFQILKYIKERYR